MAENQEVVYDAVSEVPMLNDADAPGGMGCAPSGPSGKPLPVVNGQPVNLAATQADGLGCHSGKEQMLEAARAAGKSAGIFAGNAQAARGYAAAGYNFIALAADVVWLLAGARGALAEARG